MAAGLWIVKKADDNRHKVEGITTVIINDDDLTSAADVIIATTTAVQTAGIDIPDDYFDSAALWNAVGQLDTDGDLIAFDERVEAIA